MNDVIETIHDGGNTINIYYDIDPSNPREEWDNLGTMVMHHDRMNLGDTGKLLPSWYSSWIEFFKDNPSLILPIWAYEHGGITITASDKVMGYPYTDLFDSGWIGFIFVTFERIKSEYHWKYLTSKRILQVKQYLEGEVETYDMYLTGQVYGYKVVCETCEEELDSCWGFFGYDHKESGLLESAQGHECENCKTLQTRLDAIGALAF